MNNSWCIYILEVLNAASGTSREEVEPMQKINKTNFLFFKFFWSIRCAVVDVHGYKRPANRS